MISLFIVSGLLSIICLFGCTIFSILYSGFIPSLILSPSCVISVIEQINHILAKRKKPITFLNSLAKLLIRRMNKGFTIVVLQFWMTVSFQL